MRLYQWLDQGPLVMGILNVTPDSFSDGGQYQNIEQAIKHAEEMIRWGAKIIDVGGESTRPGYRQISDAEEIGRIVPVLKELRSRVSVPLSVDTYKPTVAKAALQAGATVVNDIWGLSYARDMAAVIKEYDADVVIMHNQKGTAYGDYLAEIMLFFEKQIAWAHKHDIPPEHIVLDPGFGFGKTAEQNLYLMKHLERLHIFTLPILVGTSRKSTIGKVLDVPVQERLIGSLATVASLYFKGAQIFRVHDVKETVQLLTMLRVIDHAEL